MSLHQSQPDRVQKHHDDLTGEYIYGDLIQLVCLVIFLIVWIADSIFLHKTDYSSLLTPYLRVPAGMIILVASFYVASTGLKIVFGTEHPEPTVIDYGVFKWVRHPIYLSALGFYLGLLWIKFSLSATGIWLGIIVMYYFLSRFEEQLLIKRFGTQYTAYMKRVPMLFPKLFRGK